MRCFIGIDPGAKGAVAVLSEAGSILGVCRLSATPRDVVDFLRETTAGYEPVAALEKVHAMPGDGERKMGASGAFKFGWVAGGLEWALVALGYRYELVQPAAWQRGVGVPPRGKASKTDHKGALKARAQGLFPSHRVTLWDADALLLAEFCRRTMA